jgi:hypothetical protein
VIDNSLLAVTVEVTNIVTVLPCSVTVPPSTVSTTVVMPLGGTIIVVVDVVVTELWGTGKVEEQ